MARAAPSQTATGALSERKKKEEEEEEEEGGRGEESAYLAETEFAVVILVQFGDHGFEAEVSLRCLEPFHRYLQFLKIQVAITTHIVPVSTNNG